MTPRQEYTKETGGPLHVTDSPDWEYAFSPEYVEWLENKYISKTEALRRDTDLPNW